MSLMITATEISEHEGRTASGKLALIDGHCSYCSRQWMYVFFFYSYSLTILYII